MRPFPYYFVFFFLLLIVALAFILAMWFFGSSQTWIQFSLINVLFLFTLTLLSFGLFYFTFRESNKNAPLLAVLLSFTGKLIFSGLMVLILDRILTLQAIPFFVTFAISYIWFTVPEVVSLVRIGDRISRKEKGDS